jgi:hypothetical protein
MTTYNNSTNTSIPSGVSAGSYTNANITVNAAGQITAASSGGSGTVVNQTTSTATLAAGNVYVNNYTGGQTVFTLPATAAVGDEYTIIGGLAGSGGWQVAEASGQTIHFGTATCTTTSGTLTSSNQFDCVTIRCVTANTTFTAYATQGNIAYA